MRSIEEINKKIESGDANIFTAEEFKQLVKDDDAPSFDEVDVVTNRDLWSNEWYCCSI